MSVLKSLCIAFSIYSKIPVPQFDWKEKDMQYSLIFFPWVGAAVGGAEWLWLLVAETFKIGMLAFALVGVALPLLVTGGFHMDGYMDTMDALHSYRSREEKLAILKDPHIGAFSVIMLVIYLMIEVAGFSEIQSKKAYVCMCGGFFLARALSGLMVVSLPAAKKDGLLVTFAATAHRSVVRAALTVQVVAGIGFLFAWGSLAAVVIVDAMLLFLLFYIYRMRKQFGGITGDTAGYFVTICELLAVLGAAVGSRL
ncbi:MAG: adenosylcobinamide-GDP ribazoletransferase [Lachnospiraceae bacterium]|nr:adenosylcobinamide-GDP ribazoletransferase [Lachnospiraceae bacterium]